MQPMQIVSKKHWMIDCGVVAYTEELYPCADLEAVHEVLRGYRLRQGTPLLAPSVVLSLLDIQRPQYAVALYGGDGLETSLTLHTLH